MSKGKQIFPIGIGVMLLCLVVFPKLASEDPRAPMALHLLRYETNASSAQTEVVLEAKNNTGHLVFFGMGQPEFLVPPHPWETSSMETNYPVAKLNPKETSVFRIGAPPEARAATWRLPFYCVVSSSQMQRRIGRILSFLKLKEIRSASLAVLLYSEDLPPTSVTARSHTD